MIPILTPSRILLLKAIILFFICGTCTCRFDSAPVDQFFRPYYNWEIVSTATCNPLGWNATNLRVIVKKTIFGLTSCGIFLPVSFRAWHRFLQGTWHSKYNASNQSIRMNWNATAVLLIVEGHSLCRINVNPCSSWPQNTTGTLCCLPVYTHKKNKQTQLSTGCIFLGPTNLFPHMSTSIYMHFIGKVCLLYLFSLWTLTCLYRVAVPVTLTDLGKIINNWLDWGRIYNNTPS